MHWPFLLGALLLAGCTAPVVMSTAYAPPTFHRDTRAANEAGSAQCRVFVATVKDMRGDTQSMGTILARPVRNADSAGWVRSGLLSLDHDKRIHMADSAQSADITLDAEILKAYVMAITTQKTANVVLRIRYTRAGGAPEEQIYRGALNDVDWIGGDDETQGALNDALTQVVTAVAGDTIKRCKA
jgi:hypothetical protein